ncbi:hypothetical protein C6Y61_22860 [Salmonella enterica]|nr:hypothetical protein [Salmonella enterica]EBP3563963.1 hypothetical protein [Salmonella enterica subsp. enterica]EDT1320194.1 hypothetical protein [Salmonella enterica subsp. enterica serovar Mississippi]EAX9069603.1 hypothetical protein [Salmonella enterica]EBI7611013.1 hypothetical protein [Salmonella enterica]
MKTKILNFILEIKKTYKTTEIAAHFGLSVYQARYYLMSLENDGVIRRSPLHRGVSTLWETVKGTGKNNMGIPVLKKTCPPKKTALAKALR